MSRRTALVTGSVRRLGLEMARGLARAGARVVLNGRDAGTLDAAAARLRDEGLNVTAAAFDVTDQDTARESVTALGPVDVLVNNVGHRDRRGVDALAPGDLARLLEVHLVSAYALSQVVARDLTSRGLPGRIINVSSVMGQLGRAGDVAYAAAKAGLDGLTRALAADLGPSGITVNSVAPARSPPRSTPSTPTTSGGPTGCDRGPRSAAGGGPRKSPGSWSSWPATPRRSSPARPSQSTAG